jgi:hypothetical protein
MAVRNIKAGLPPADWPRRGWHRRLNAEAESAPTTRRCLPLTRRRSTRGVLFGIFL